MLSGDRRPTPDPIRPVAEFLAGQVARECLGLGGCGQARIKPAEARSIAAGLQAQGFLLADAAAQLEHLMAVNQKLNRENLELRRQFTAAATLKTADGWVVGMG